MKDYKTILFDLDGTLINPGEGITNSAIYALKKLGVTPPPIDVLYRFIGPPLYDSFANFCGLSEQESQKAVGYYREYFSKNGINEQLLYPGIKELLKMLHDKGKTIILATSKPEEFAKTIIDNHALTHYFTYIAGATMDCTRNKKADVIEYALSSSRITDRTTAVMIGDREHDIIGAKKCNIDSIGVLYGYGDEPELIRHGADCIASSVNELIQLLQ